MKQQYFDLALKVAEPLLRDLREGKPDLTTVSDCALAGVQIQQGTRNPLRPLRVLELVYGLAEDGKL